MVACLVLCFRTIVQSSCKTSNIRAITVAINCGVGIIFLLYTIGYFLGLQLTFFHPSPFKNNLYAEKPGWFPAMRAHRLLEGRRQHSVFPKIQRADRLLQSSCAIAFVGLAHQFLGVGNAAG